MDARRALELIPEESGLSLEACVRMALHVGEGERRGVLVSEAVDKFLHSQLSEVSPNTWRFYEQNLRTFELAAGEEKLSAIDRPWLRNYFDGVEKGRPQRWRAVRRLLGWSVAEGLLTRFPAEGFSIKDQRPREIDILTPFQVRALFLEGGIYTAAFALGVLAGIRPHEIHDKNKPAMAWSQVNFETRTIRVDASQAKTGVARVIDEKLPKRIWAVLRLGKKRLEKAGFGTGPEDPVSPYRARQVADTGKEILGEWSQDVLRHTCATAHVAAFGDLTAISLILGHEGGLRTLHRNYRGRMTKADGERIMKGGRK